MTEQGGIVLASASPRRVELLESAGIAFTVCPADIAEELQEGESAVDHARRLAREKALHVAGQTSGSAGQRRCCPRRSSRCAAGGPGGAARQPDQARGPA